MVIRDESIKNQLGDLYVEVGDFVNVMDDLRVRVTPRKMW